MHWDDVDVFCRVVEHGSFTAGARAMERPKSSISVSIGRLEETLGTRLIERTTRRFRLTEAGEKLYHSVGAPFSALRQASAEALAERDTVGGLLRVAAPYEFGAHHLGPVACALMQRYPALRVQIDVEHGVVNPLERHYDVTFAMLESGLPTSSLVVRRIFSLERAVFASPELLKTHGEPETPADLAELPLLVSPIDHEWTFQGPDGAQSVEIAAPRLTSSNAGLRLQAACSGLGVARITATFCAADVAAGRLRRILPEHACAPLRVYALLPGKHLLAPKVRLFLDALAEHAAGGASA